MQTYTKINTMFMRDERGLIIPGEWATPEIAWLSENKWHFTEKVDGTNIRVFVGEPDPERYNNISYGGRTDDGAGLHLP